MYYLPAGVRCFGLNRQHLVISVRRQHCIAFESDQLHPDKTVPCDLELPEVQVEGIADFLFAIEAYTITVGGQRQKQIQRQILMCHHLQKTIL